MIVIREYGKVAYRGNLPKSFRNSNMNCTGLDKATPESLLSKGIYPLEVVRPEFDPATHTLNGYVDKLAKGVNVQTYIVRAKTKVELDAELDAEYRQKIEAEKERLAVASLITKEELPADYKPDTHG